MKLKKHYILSLIVVMLTAMSFDISTPKFIDSTIETQIEISLEEKKSEKISEEKLIVNVSEHDLKHSKVFTGFYCSMPFLYSELP